MGQRGPIPVSDLPKGSHHKRTTSAPRIEPEVRVPAYPRGFNEKEREHWRALWRTLIDMKIGTRVDHNIVRNCARNRANIDKYWEVIEKFNASDKNEISGHVMIVGGEVVDGKRVGGQMQPNTLITLYNQAVERDTKLFGSLLAQDPSSRARLQMPATNEKPKSRWGDTKPILTSKPA